MASEAELATAVGALVMIGTVNILYGDLGPYFSSSEMACGRPIAVPSIFYRSHIYTKFF